MTRKAKNRLSATTHLSLPSDSEDRGAKPVSNRRRPTVTHRPHKETAITNGDLEISENEKKEEEAPLPEVKLEVPPNHPEIKLLTPDLGECFLGTERALNCLAEIIDTLYISY